LFISWWIKKFVNTLFYLGPKCKSWKLILLHIIWNRLRWKWRRCLELNEQLVGKIFLRKPVLGFDFGFRILDFQLISDFNGILSDELLLKINCKLKIPIKMSWNMWTKVCKVPNCRLLAISYMHPEIHLFKCRKN
jgi:hypothetical protein